MTTQLKELQDVRLRMTDEVSSMREEVLVAKIDRDATQHEVDLSMLNDMEDMRNACKQEYMTLLDNELLDT